MNDRRKLISHHNVDGVEHVSINVRKWSGALVFIGAALATSITVAADSNESVFIWANTTGAALVFRLQVQNNGAFTEVVSSPPGPGPGFFHSQENANAR